jgi:hypothetical protein
MGDFRFFWVGADTAFTLSTAPPYSAWKKETGGIWCSNGNWTNSYPTGVDATAIFAGAIVQNSTVNVDQPVTLGSINFDNAAYQYTLGGTNAITLSTTSGPAYVNVLSGSHTITAPLVVNSDLAVDVASPTSVLSITGSVSSSLSAITKSGAGTLAVENIRAASLAVDGGVVQVSTKASANHSAGTSVVTGVSVVPGAQLDLANNALVVDYADVSPLYSIAALLQTGYNFGTWDGEGIISSRSATSPNPPEVGITAIGFAESLEILGAGGGTFAGQSVDGTAVLLKYTYASDANLDLAVDTVDFNFLAGNFSAAGATWTQGDFNYDGVVDTVDFGILAANFGNALPAGGFELIEVVPEPALLLAAAWPALLLAGGRSHRRRWI